VRWRVPVGWYLVALFTVPVGQRCSPQRSNNHECADTPRIGRRYEDTHILTAARQNE
jgi:hypothetical protein